MPPDQRCELCRYFNYDDPPMPDLPLALEGKGRCLRFPPTIVFHATAKEAFYQLSRFPDVDPNWCCGEFKAVAEI